VGRRQAELAEQPPRALPLPAARPSPGQPAPGSTQHRALAPARATAPPWHRWVSLGTAMAAPFGRA